MRVPRMRSWAWVAVLVAGLMLVAACGGERTTLKPEHDRTPAHTLITPDQPTTTRPAQARPNLFVIETDDMRWDELRFMPNVRRLIQDRGLTFQNAFAPYPLCCPSRASFLSGQYVHNNHVYSVDDPWAFRAFKDKTSIATVLQDSGYNTGLVGKYLNKYGEQDIRGTKTSSLHYVPPGWSQWYAGSDHLWKPWDSHQGGTYSYFNLTQNINGKIVSFPGEYTSDVTGRQTRGLIDSFGKTAKPWFIWWTPVAPHFGSPTESDDPKPTRRVDGKLSTWETPARPDWVKGRFDAEITHGLGTPAKGSAEADLTDKPRFFRKYPLLNKAEKKAEVILSRQRAESLFALDVQIGRSISRLSRTGQLDNTVVMFTSDNGYYLGEHRKRSGKIVLHEPSLRVPLLVAGPGVPVGRRYDPATPVDMASTLAGYAGVEMPDSDGLNLVPTIEQGDRGWVRPVVTESRIPAARYVQAAKRKGWPPLTSRGVRLGQWKLTRYASGEGELYDLATDPLELTNRYQDPAFADERKQMDKIWKTYRSCKGAKCLAPLPKDHQLTPQQNKALTDAQVAETDRYFGNPPAHQGLSGPG